MCAEHFEGSFFLGCRLNIFGFVRTVEKPKPSSKVETAARAITVRSVAPSPCIHLLRPGQTDK